MILFDNVSKSFHNKQTNTTINALLDITLHISQGEAIGVIGKSGAGKTTFLKLISGLIMSDKGRVRVNDIDPVNGRKHLSKDIGVLFADTMSIYEDNTVNDNFKHIKTIYKISDNIYNDNLSRLIYSYKIECIMNEKVNKLSLGLRRRVELIALFLIPSKLIIMDEPCIGLDALAKEAFKKDIKHSLNNGKTVIISAHNMSEIESLCSRIIMLNQGKLIYYGQKEALYHALLPINSIYIKCKGKIPDIQDLPIIKYELKNNKLNNKFCNALSHNNNHNYYNKFNDIIFKNQAFKNYEHKDNEHKDNEHKDNENGDYELEISYNINKISSSEIIKTIIQSTKIEEIKITTPSLEDIFSLIN